MGSSHDFQSTLGAGYSYRETSSGLISSTGDAERGRESLLESDDPIGQSKFYDSNRQDGFRCLPDVISPSRTLRQAETHTVLHFTLARMAPTQNHAGKRMQWASTRLISTNSRSLSSGDMSYAASFTAHEMYVMQVTAVLFATVSVLAAIVTFYWFSKMRRSFRHDLVIVLIGSDLLKSLWYLVSPVAALAHGPIDNSSPFCQISGFFVAVGSEGADIAVLLIAIHTALTIFKHNRLGESGLYRYRRAAFLFWFIFPLLAASLAFINPHGGYRFQGTICWLPIRPFWYRLALSWIPRYIVLLTIYGICLAIFIYVKRHFKTFSALKGDRSDSYGTNSNAMSFDGTADNTDSWREIQKFMDIELPMIKPAVPPLPKLNCHGLLPPSEENLVETWRGGDSSVRCLFNDPFRGTTSEAGPSNLPNEKDDSPFGATILHRSMHDALTGSLTQKATPQHSPSTTPEEVMNMDFVSPSEDNSIIGMLQALSDVVASPAAAQQRPFLEQPGLSLEKMATFAMNNPASTQYFGTKRLIQRQLRLVFIYPFTYGLMWLVPFALHCLQYTTYFSQHPPVGLVVAVNMIVAGQCAVDCFIFSTREKPWRYIPGSRGTLLDSFLFWTHDRRAADRVRTPKRSKENKGRSPGKSRAEMAADADVAYKRRDKEMVEWLEKRRLAELAKLGCEGDKGGENKDWWDDKWSRRRSISGLGRNRGSISLGVSVERPKRVLVK
ncbi:MAG: hypothetical protein M1827_002310 [Pycnora praestabilis]|nr:MAG: hypothetical protein M1827_002310 [Pycnora praestabilis]